MSGKFEYSACRADELPGLIAKLDLEFVSGRGRTISLAHRFPASLAPANLGNIFVARAAQRAVAAIVVKRFAWIADAREYAGAMIGMVWTDPAHRGQGTASKLLAHVGDVLRADTDFAVLWTANPGFYARSSWIAQDCGSFGEIDGAGAKETRGAAPDFARVRGIWEKQAQRAARDAAWQPPLPLAASSLEMHAAASAYALAGRQGETLYCHEILGDAAGCAIILRDMRAACSRLCFNERTASQAYAWLAQHGVRWQEKPLAMWLPLRILAAPDPALRWYIPFLDRI